MLKTYIKWYVLSSISICIIFIAGCGMMGEPDLKKFSPKQSYEYYDKARHDGNVEALRKIMYFSPAMSEEEKQDKAKKTVACSTEKMYNKGIWGLIRPKVVYEKILSENTAQVGVVFQSKISFRPGSPFNEIILKKEDDIWKIYAYKTDIVYVATIKELLEGIKKNPNDASAYYYLGKKYETEKHYVKAQEYYKKYLELEPKGFWATDNLRNKIKEKEEIEKKLLENLKGYSRETSIYKEPNMAYTYKKLGYYYMDVGENEKALNCFKEGLSLKVFKDDEEDMRKALKEVEKLMSEEK